VFCIEPSVGNTDLLKAEVDADLFDSVCARQECLYRWGLFAWMQVHLF
jgi:hypothetical protein